MGTMFRVRIPTWARAAFHGEARLARRFTNEAAGEAWVRDLQLKLAKLKAGAEVASLGIQPAKTVDFRTAAGGWLSQADIRERTRIWYRNHLNAHLLDRFGSLKLTQLNRNLILDHLEQRKRAGASPINISRDVVILKVILNWARRRGYHIDPSCFEVKKPRTTPTVTRRFDPQAMERFLDAVTGRDRVILEVASWTGFRAGELRAFNASWIRWHEERIFIPHDTSFSPKGRKPRSIPVFPKLASILKEWLGDRREGLVFPPLRARSKHGANLGASLRRVFVRAREASGVPYQGLHDLRHYPERRIIPRRRASGALLRVPLLRQALADAG